MANYTFLHYYVYYYYYYEQNNKHDKSIPIMFWSFGCPITNGDFGRTLSRANCAEKLRSAFRTVFTFGDRMGKLSI